jgi:GR25 family glycosyltransferase involved in LPS biosynthesis
MNILIFVINLKSSPGRKAHIIRQMQELDLRYELIEAVDGEQIVDYELGLERRYF